MKPTYRVTLDGKDVTEKWGKVLTSLSLTDEAGVKADTCAIGFDNRGRFAAPPIGAEMQVWLGYEPEPIYKGRFKVSSWEKEGPVRRLTVECASADLTSKIRAPRTRSFHDKTVKQIVDDVAKDHGLKASVDSGIGARKIDHIDQQTESDVAFLTRLASRNGATFKLADGKVLFAAKGSRKLPDGTTKSVIGLQPKQTSSWRVRCDTRGDYKSASATYMDPTTRKRKSAVAGSGEPRFRDKRLYGSQAEAQAAAEAKLGELTRGQMSIEIEMGGDPRLFAEALVKLEGFDADVDGEYLAKSVRHEFSRGYRTSLSLETEGKSEAAAE